MTNRKELLDKIADSLRITVSEVFHTMAWSEVVFTGSEEIPTFIIHNINAGITQIFGSLTGMIAITCDDTLTRNIVARISGLMPEELIHDDLLDGMGELANMVSGGMKSKASLGSIQLSPPISILGGSYSAHCKTDRPTLLLNFQVEGHALKIFACL